MRRNAIELDCRGLFETIGEWLKQQNHPLPEITSAEYKALLLRLLCQYVFLPAGIILIALCFSLRIGMAVFVVIVPVLGLKRLISVSYIVAGLLLAGSLLFILLGFSNQLPVMGMVLIGYVVWSVIAQLLNCRMLNRKALAIALPIVVFFVSTAVVARYVSWLPYPPWCERHIVRACDYQAMERIFRKPLPASFRILSVNYPGYSQRGKDGPELPRYEISVNAGDYAILKGIMQTFDDKTREMTLVEELASDNSSASSVLLIIRTYEPYNNFYKRIWAWF